MQGEVCDLLVAKTEILALEFAEGVPKPVQENCYNFVRLVCE